MLGLMARLFDGCSTLCCARPKKSGLRGGLFLALCLPAVTARFLYGLLGLDRRHKTETGIVALNIFDAPLTEIQ